MASNKKALARQECYMALTAATTAYDDASFKQAFATAYKGSTAERVIEDIKEKHKNEERARCPLRFVPLFRDGSWPGHASYCCCFRQVEIIDNGNLRVEHMTRASDPKFYALFDAPGITDIYVIVPGRNTRVTGIENPCWARWMSTTLKLCDKKRLEFLLSDLMPTSTTAVAAGVAVKDKEKRKKERADEKKKEKEKKKAKVKKVIDLVKEDLSSSSLGSGDEESSSSPSLPSPTKKRKQKELVSAIVLTPMDREALWDYDDANDVVDTIAMDIAPLTGFYLDKEKPPSIADRIKALQNEPPSSHSFLHGILPSSSSSSPPDKEIPPAMTKIQVHLPGSINDASYRALTTASRHLLWHELPLQILHHSLVGTFLTEKLSTFIVHDGWRTLMTLPKEIPHNLKIGHPNYAQLQFHALRVPHWSLPTERQTALTLFMARGSCLMMIAADGLYLQLTSTTPEERYEQDRMKQANLLIWSNVPPILKDEALFFGSNALLFFEISRAPVKMHFWRPAPTPTTVSLFGLTPENQSPHLHQDEGGEAMEFLPYATIARDYQRLLDYMAKLKADETPPPPTTPPLTTTTSFWEQTEETTTTSLNGGVREHLQMQEKVLGLFSSAEELDPFLGTTILHGITMAPLPEHLKQQIPSDKQSLLLLPPQNNGITFSFIFSDQRRQMNKRSSSSSAPRPLTNAYLSQNGHLATVIVHEFPYQVNLECASLEELKLHLYKPAASEHAAYTAFTKAVQEERQIMKNIHDYAVEHPDSPLSMEHFPILCVAREARLEAEQALWGTPCLVFTLCPPAPPTRKKMKFTLSNSSKNILPNGGGDGSDERSSLTHSVGSIPPPEAAPHH